METVNAAGGLAGVGLLALARRRLRSNTATTMTWALAIGTVFVLVASAMFATAPPLIMPPRHIGATAPG